ncbi:MAG: hypothetical protein HYR95_01780 [Candidatus Colwellbacteria bacterium]|nr:hypothetical protein [Candidatus Colwellbacteria bacterium]
MTRFGKWYKEVVMPAGLLAALIIGAGMFALPYVFSEAGFVTGFFYLALFAAVFGTVHLMYAEVIIGTKGEHRFVGYAQIYLGTGAKSVSVVTTLVGLLLTLAIYIILSVSFIKLVFPAIPSTAAAIAFWALGSMVIVFSLKKLAILESIVTPALIGIVLILFIFGVSAVGTVSLPGISGNLPKLFLPYGIVLFSLSGRAAISSVRDYYRKNKLDEGRIGQAIALGTIVPAVIYFIFAVSVFWLSPNGVSLESVSGLAFIPPVLLGLVGILGFVSIWDSYFFLCLEAKDIFVYDFGLPSVAATGLALATPLALYFYGNQNLLGFMGVAGGIFLAIESVLVVLMRNRLKRIGAWGYFIITVFVTGALYELAKLF